MNPFPTLSGDFCISMYLNTALPLPNSRETVLHYFETLQRAFPMLDKFQNRDQGEYVLENDKQAESYRWAALEQNRIGSGYVNPPELEDADQQHLRILELSPYHLGITSLDCESLDVAYVFDMQCRGHHDEVVAEALAMHSPLEPMLNIPGARVMKYEPLLMITLNEEQQLHCRLRIETRTTPQEGNEPSGEEPLSVYFTVRQYWRGQPIAEFLEAYHRQREICQELVEQHVIPAILQPLAQVIATK